MFRSNPPLVRLSELTPGQYADFFAQLSQRTKSKTRDDRPYYNCRFRDNRRSVSLIVWPDSPWFPHCEQGWREGQFYKLRAVYIDNEKYGPQIYELQDIQLVTDKDQADGFDPAQFVEHSRHDSEAMFAELKGLAQTHIADAPLRRLVLTLLDRHAVPFKRLPATPNKFHPFYGGLLEHTLAVTKTCLWLAERYAAYYTELKPPLNRDLVVAGAILHDMGRVVEFGEDGVASQPTVPGRLSGHLILGRDLVRDMARELGDVNPELVLMLEHIVLTHLSLPEWGSPRLPLVPECLIIHHADDLDAKLEMYVRCLSRDQEPGAFTASDPMLKRQLFKGRSV